MRSAGGGLKVEGFDDEGSRVEDLVQRRGVEGSRGREVRSEE